MKNFVLIFLILTTGSAFAKNAAETFILRGGLSPISLEELTYDEEGLKIMWWNIGCSSTRGLKKLSDSDRSSIDPQNQWTNLKLLVNSERLIPDILILGEYCPSNFDDRIYKEVKSKYKNVYRLNKSNPLFRIRNGLRVFSKYKIENIQEKVLNAETFVDTELMRSCAADVKKRNPKSFGEKKYWNRPKISFTVEHNKRNYKIAPVHLANPWAFVKSCAGLWSTPGIIKHGVENANFVQAEQLVQSFSESDSTVLIGDFNAPKSILGGTSNSYRILSESFGPSVIELEDYTYSDPRRNFPHYSIDHAFVSGDINIKRGVVLPFAGSDHLPIYIVID